MKLGIITSALFVMAGCSSSLEHGPALPQRAHDVATVSIPASEDSHLVWCKDAEGCFSSAGLMCGELKRGINGELSQHPKPGRYHQVPENGMAFPAMVEVPGGWRMLIVCDESGS